jgi:4-amino-4-deoxychorismate lyase
MSASAGRDNSRHASPVQVTVNGHPVDTGLSLFDRGLHFGDGLFETIACRNGTARFLALHLERLVRSCERLRINLGDVNVVRQELQATAARAGDALLKLIVTRGDAVARGYGWSGTEVATRVVFQYPLPPENVAAVRDGIRVRTARLRYGENEQLAGMKHLNRLEQVLARSEVSAEDADELLVYSSSGLLASGTMSNVFLVQGGRVRTPRLDRCGVAGVMRRAILREAAALGAPVDEAPLTAQDVARCDELFLTNARIGIWPVRLLDDRALEVGPVTRGLQKHMAPLLERPADA